MFSAYVALLFGGIVFLSSDHPLLGGVCLALVVVWNAVAAPKGKSAIENFGP